MSENIKIVSFSEYCGSCKFHENKEELEPCYSCLNIPGRTDSKKPEYYVRNEE